MEISFFFVGEEDGVSVLLSGGFDSCFSGLDESDSTAVSLDSSSSSDCSVGGGGGGADSGMVLGVDSASLAGGVDSLGSSEVFSVTGGSTGGSAGAIFLYYSFILFSPVKSFIIFSKEEYSVGFVRNGIKRLKGGVGIHK
jgi:hypothetical protein